MRQKSTNKESDISQSFHLLEDNACLQAKARLERSALPTVVLTSFLKGPPVGP